MDWYTYELLLLIFFIFCFLGLHLRHMEDPKLGAELELLLLVYTTATATWDLSHICNLYHSSQQHWILNLLSKARDRTCILMDTCQVHHLVSHHGNSQNRFNGGKNSQSSIQARLYFCDELWEPGLVLQYQTLGTLKRLSTLSCCHSFIWTKLFFWEYPSGTCLHSAAPYL